MARPSDPGFLVLHELRVKGIAPLMGHDPVAVQAQATAGLIGRREGIVAGWRLTPAGRLAHERAVAADVAGLEDGLTEGYRRFLALNPALLSLCTAWQRSGERATVVDGLDGLHRAAAPVLDGLARLLERYGAYRDRLAEARTRVRAGELDYVARPLVDSYHTVWSELHEDLLASLGIARSSEPVVETEVA
ncbi:MAG: MarR family transcriptional regulator [Acidimicrobiia bacterium]